MRRAWIAAPLVGSLALGASSGSAQSHGESARGRQVYERYCTQCHGARGDGGGEVARWAQPRPRDFRQGLFKFRSTPYGSLPTVADLDRIIQDGLFGTYMPPFDAVSVRERRDVIAYLQTLSPRWRSEQQGTPILVPSEPAPTREAVTRGRELFGANCSTCHGDGTGNGPQANALVDAWSWPIRPADLTQGRTKSAHTARDIYLRVMTGINGTPMPGFAGALTPEQVWQIAHYIQALGAWPGSTPELRQLVASLPPPAAPPPAAAPPEDSTPPAEGPTPAAAPNAAMADSVRPDSIAPKAAAPEAPRAARRRAPIVVRMLGDAKGYRFEPASIKARVGDVVRFVSVSSGPHNVSFWGDSIPAGSATKLQQNMGPTMSPLNGVLLTQANATYRVSLTGLSPGTYKFYCMPHLALGMKGQIVIQP
jgi:cytochrome c oxidase cbb3-type subunit 2